MVRWATAAFLLGLSVGQVQAETVKVGLAFHTAGLSNRAIAQLRDGFELGLRHAATTSGPHQLSLAILGPGDGEDAARLDAFVKQEAPRVLVAAQSRLEASAQLKSFSDSGIVVVSPGEGGAELAGKRCLANVFVTGAQANQGFDTIAQYVDNSPLKRVVVVHDEAHAGRIEALRRSAKTAFLRVVGIAVGDGEYDDDVEKLMLDQPQTVILAGSATVSARFLRALRAHPIGREAVVIASAAGEESDLSEFGDMAVGLLAPGSWATGIEGQANAEFVNAFTQGFGAQPSSLAVYAYDAARLLGTALATISGPVTTKALRDAMHAANLASPRGALTFSNNNFPIQNFYMKRIEAGEGGAFRSVPVARVFEQFADDFAADCPLR